MAVEKKSLQALFNCCSPYGSREAFVRSCDRLSKLDVAALVIEGSISRILQTTEFSSMHPNAVFGTIQRLAVRWGIQPWFAPTWALAEEITAVGDALGTTLEFARPGTFKPIKDVVRGGPFRLKAGECTDANEQASR